MRTKLSAFCDNLIQACGLAVVVVLPVYMITYAARIFELTKGHLLRSIALTMLVAWIAAAVERRGSGAGGGGGPLQTLRRFLRRPLVAPALLVALVYLVASSASVWPRASFFGSYRRLQGVYTTLAYLVLFFTIWTTFRRREPVERLVQFAVLTSAAVAGYAVMQHFGVDPMAWGRDVSQRVTSTLGNPIFVSAYLIMVIPLTARQIIRGVQRLRAPSSASSSRPAVVALYSLALVLQLTAVVFTQSRGPFMGLLGSVFFFLLLGAAYQRRRGLGLAGIGLALMVGLFLVVLNLPDSPLAPLRELPYVGRLGAIARSQGLESRFLIWQGAAEMVSSSPLRTLIGHGPEVMMEAYQPYISPELYATEYRGLAHDRCHNAIWQALVDRGIVGLLTDLLLFGSFFYYGFRWLGLLRGRRDRNLFITLSAGGMAAGLLVPWVVLGRVALIGLGVPAGLLAGLAAYLTAQLFLAPEGDRPEARGSLLVIALLAGVAAHVIEIQTGIAVAVTRSHLWLYAALMLVLGLHLSDERPFLPPLGTAPPRQRRASRRRGRAGDAGGEALFSRGLLTGSLGAGLLLVTLVFSLIMHRFEFPGDAPALGFFGAVWLFAGLLVTLHEIGGTSSEPDAGGGQRLAVYAGLSLVFACLPILAHVAALPPTPNVGRIAVAQFAALGGCVVVIAFALLRGRPLPRRFSRGSTSWLYAALAGAAGVAIILTNLNPVRANITFDAARSLADSGQLDTAVSFYQRARRLAPGQARYAFFLGRAYVRLAQAEDDHPEVLLREAEEVLAEAKRLSPLDPEVDANLGQVFWYRAELVAGTPQETAERLETALRYYQRAVEQSPIVQGDLLQEPIMAARMELARAYREMGRTDEALEQARAAAALAPPDRREEIEGLLAELAPECTISGSDLEAAMELWRCGENEDCYDPKFDQDGDGKITVVDITRMVEEWRQNCPQGE